jgi:hypothetical protein
MRRQEESDRARGGRKANNAYTKATAMRDDGPNQASRAQYYN